MNDTDQERVHDMGTERYALELRAEAINLIAGEKAERQGLSDRLEIGAESATDKVAGGEDLSVGRALIEKANTASTTGLVLNTTVHGHLNANYYTDNIMLTGAMSETYAGALVTVAGMSDVIAAGGGMRVVAGADIRLSGLTGMEEKLFTLMNDGIMIDVFANAFEREFGTAIHNAVTGIISSKVEILTATTWRPMMKTLVGLRSKNKGSAAGGDGSIKSPPEAPPPPAGGEDVAATGKLLSTGGKSLKRTASSPNISLLSNLDSTVKLDEVAANANNGITVGRLPETASSLEDLRVVDNAAELRDARPRRPRRSDSFLHPDITTLRNYRLNKSLADDVDVDGLVTYLQKNIDELNNKNKIVVKKMNKENKKVLDLETWLNSRPWTSKDKSKLENLIRKGKLKVEAGQQKLINTEANTKLRQYAKENALISSKIDATEVAIDSIRKGDDPIDILQQFKFTKVIEQRQRTFLKPIDEVIDTVEDGLVNYTKHSDSQGSNSVRVTDTEIGNESYLNQSSSVYADEIPAELVRRAEGDDTIRTTESINQAGELDKEKLLKRLNDYQGELHTQFNKKYKSQVETTDKAELALELQQIQKRRLALVDIIKSIRNGVDPQVALDSEAFKNLDESQAIEDFVNSAAQVSRRSLEEPVETPPSPIIRGTDLNYLSPEDLDLGHSSDYPVPNKRRNTIIMETRDFDVVPPAAKTDAALAVVKPRGKSSRKGDFSQIEEGIQSRLQITPDQVQIDETGKIPTQAPAAEINVRKLSQSDAATPILDNGQAQWVKSLPDNIRELEVGAFSKAGDEALSSTRLEGLDDSRRAEISSDPTNGVRAVEPDSTAARAEESSVAEDPVIRNDQQQWTEESKQLQQPGGNSGETRRRSSFQNDRSQKGAPKAIDNTTEALESARTQTAIDRAEFDIQSRYASMRDIIGENHYKYQEKTY